MYSEVHDFRVGVWLNQCSRTHTHTRIQSNRSFLALSSLFCPTGLTRSDEQDKASLFPLWIVSSLSPSNRIQPFFFLDFSQGLI
ncbi:hypothetical protein [Phaffia rhodozyma]|uniref:Uncharacterized protein n=1 Tax=Phaffia rhodozyma TaxID=264483 RepID=A0A0F7SPW3_PHARH|nr:hypothetical protein [Phaffia rhodozyma]